MKAFKYVVYICDYNPVTEERKNCIAYEYDRRSEALRQLKEALRMGHCAAIKRCKR